MTMAVTVLRRMMMMEIMAIKEKALVVTLVRGLGTEEMKKKRMRRGTTTRQRKRKRKRRKKERPKNLRMIGTASCQQRMGRKRRKSRKAKAQIRNLNPSPLHLHLLLLPKSLQKPLTISNWTMAPSINQILRIIIPITILQPQNQVVLQVG